MAETRRDAEFERRLAWALRAEEAEVPVRLRTADLEARWARRRGHPWRRLAAAAAAIALAVTGLAWATHAADPILRAIAGPISTDTPGPSMPEGMSLGRATLTLTAPVTSSTEFDVTCVWSAGNRVVAMDAGRHRIAGEENAVLWRFLRGPAYELQLRRDDATIFGFTPSRPGSNYQSSASADGRSGTIAFTGIQLWSGDPATAPKRSGTFTWLCDRPSQATRSFDLPGPATGELDVPNLWLVQNGREFSMAAMGCPMTTDGLSMSCATANWWETPSISSSRIGLRTGDDLALGMAGWTITHATVRGIRADEALALPTGVSPRAGSIVTFADGLGPHPAVVTPPGGRWFVDVEIQAVRDDGMQLDGHYYASIEVTE